MAKKPDDALPRPGQIPSTRSPSFFPARLAPRQLLLSRTLAYGVGLLLPALIGLFVAAVYGEFWALVLPVPFALILAIAGAYRPRGFQVDADRVAVLRRIGPIEWMLSDIAVLRAPPAWAGSKPVAVLATRGLFGTFGWFWNREWGMHRIYMTDPAEAVEIELVSGRHIVVTPHPYRAFMTAVRDAANAAGVTLSVER
jgi:hypothetical protein